MGFRPGGPKEHENITSTLNPQPGAQSEQPESILDDDLIQASFQQLKNPPSPARPRLLQDTVQQLMLPHGRLSLVTGQAGQGKTAFLVCISGRKKGCGAEEVVQRHCAHTKL